MSSERCIPLRNSRNTQQRYLPENREVLREIQTLALHQLPESGQNYEECGIGLVLGEDRHWPGAPMRLI